MNATWPYDASHLIALGAQNEVLLCLSAEPGLGWTTAVIFNAIPRAGELVLRGFLGELPAPAA